MHLRVFFSGKACQNNNLLPLMSWRNNCYPNEKEKRFVASLGLVSGAYENQIMRLMVFLVVFISFDSLCVKLV